MMNRKPSLLALSLLAILLALPLQAETPGPAPGGEFWTSALLATPAVVKTVYSAGFVVESLYAKGGINYGGLVAAAWTIPNAMLLWNLAWGDAEGLRFWRYVSLGMDVAAFVGFAAAGTYLYAFNPPMTGSIDAATMGGLSLVISIPFGATAGLGTISFPKEGVLGR